MSSLNVTTTQEMSYDHSSGIGIEAGVKQWKQDMPAHLGCDEISSR